MVPASGKTKNFIIRAIKIHGDLYDYSKTKYVRRNSKIIIICKTHGEFSQEPRTHIAGSGCKRCGDTRTGDGNRKSTKKFITAAVDTHGDNYNYESVKYTHSHNPVKIICAIHGVFQQEPYVHRRGSGCPACGSAISKYKTASTNAEFVIKAKNKHGGEYGYSLVNYINAITPVDIICKKHGMFKQTPATHLKGSGCRKCGILKANNSNRGSTKSFINEAIKIHGELYDYSSVNYVNRKKPVKIVCRIHGSFKQKPGVHLKESGCPQCGDKRTGDSRKSNSEEFTIKAIRKHSNLYNYDLVNYNLNTTPVKIVCRKHGAFEQTPQAHLNGAGCHQCAGGISRGETELGDYIESLGVKVIRNNRALIAPYELDLYLPVFGVAIEYCGLYWHSESAGRDKNYHRMKYDMCKANKIRLITLFEDEWKNKNEIVKSMILNIVGKSPVNTTYENILVCEITWLVAKNFLNSHHILGCGIPGKYQVGAFDTGGRLIAVMIFNKLDGGLIEMKRYASEEYNNPVVSSKMFNWSINNYDFNKIITIIDLRFLENTLNSITGFKKIDEYKPDYFWAKSGDRISHHAKRSIMKNSGFSRIWDCGKLKLEWNNN